MRRARAWAWKRVARAASWVVRFAAVRAARACGCEGCQLLYDPRAQARVIEEMFGGIPEKRRVDRRPS